jgi:hypothetical protein
VVQDDEGRFWIPRYEVNTLVDLLPGKGYQVYCNPPCDFTWPAEPASPKQVAGRAVPARSPQHFAFIRTGLAYPVVVSSTGTGLAVNDEIAVYDGEICVGATVFTGSCPVVIPAWQGLPEYGLPGFVPGNNITVRAWRAQDGTEQRILSAAGRFGDGPMAALSFSGPMETAAKPAAFALEQNYPNPFNAETTINYAVPSDCPVTIRVHDITGRLVRTLADQAVSAGYHRIVWDGRDDRGQMVSSGLYLIRIRAGTMTHTKRALFMK